MCRSLSIAIFKTQFAFRSTPSFNRYLKAHIYFRHVANLLKLNITGSNVSCTIEVETRLGSSIVKPTLFLHLQMKKNVSLIEKHMRNYCAMTCQKKKKKSIIIISVEIIIIIYIVSYNI